jgi:hypothetical protein
MDTAALVRTASLVSLLALASLHARTSEARVSAHGQSCARLAPGTPVGIGVRWEGEDATPGFRVVRGRLHGASPDALDLVVGGATQTVPRSRIEWMLVSCPRGSKRAASFAGGALAGGLAGAIAGGVTMADEPGPNGLVPNRGTEAVMGGVRAGLAAGLLAAALTDPRFRDWVEVDPAEIVAHRAELAVASRLGETALLR